MKEKREIILFFTRLLMLAVMLAVLFGVIFGMTSAKNQDMSPKICAGDTGWNGNIPTEMSWYSKKRGHCIQGVLWRERKIR